MLAVWLAVQHRFLPIQPSGWSTFFGLFRDGEFEAARRELRALSHRGVEPEDPPRVVGAVLRLHRHAPGVDARASLAALVMWVDAARLGPRFSRFERWPLVRELAELPSNTPAPLERALVQYAIDGRALPVWSALSAHDELDPEGAAAVVAALRSLPCV